MSTLTRKFHPEFYGHALLYVPMMICYGLGFLSGGLWIAAIILQFFVGVFQVIAGLIHTLAGKSAIHTKYILVVIGYFILLASGSVLERIFPEALTEIFFFLMIFLIPVAIATWFINMTSWYYTGKYDQEKLSLEETQEDILDDIMLEA